MKIEEGKCYLYRRWSGVCSVRKVEKLQYRRVFYKLIYGQLVKDEHVFRGNCSLSRFRRWASKAVDENEDFSKYEGCKPIVTALLISKDGTVIARTTLKRAERFVEKGYAVKVDENVFELTTNKLQEQVNIGAPYLVAEKSKRYLVAEKSKRCAICGVSHPLSKHHIIPRRHIKKIPEDIRKNLANILFVCCKCHVTYEQIPEPLIVDDPLVWEQHFISHMKPRFLPNGWRIFDTGKRIKSIV